MSDTILNPDLVGKTNAHPNPLYTYLKQFIPRDLKSIFKYCDYLYTHSPHIYAAVTKYAIYPITDILYKSTNESAVNVHRKMFEDNLDLKGAMMQASINRQVYGNDLSSLYFPFHRFLVCEKCGHRVNSAHVDFDFRIRTRAETQIISGRRKSKRKRIPRFRFFCTECRRTVNGTVDDVMVKDKNRIHVIHWPVKDVIIEDNPLTGHAEYFYKVPDEVRTRIKKGNPHLLRTMPMYFLEAVLNGELIKFRSGKIYHMRTRAPSGIDNKWGLPGLVSSMDQFLHAAALRKANEAIALEYVTPFRIVSPKQATANADPSITISLSNWVSQMKMNFRAWRQDQLHIMFSPIPVEVQQVGGQGRALMVQNEIDKADQNIVMSMGIPLEFLVGGLSSAAGRSVDLRMLENQFHNLTVDLVKYGQWIVGQVDSFMGYPEVEIDLEPFKLIDDVQQKNMLLQANQAMGGQLLAPRSVAEIFDRDLNEERKLRKEDMIDEERHRIELDRDVHELHANLAAQSQRQAEMGQPMGYNQFEIVAEAERIAQQLLTLDEGMRRSELDNLSKQDFVMYSVVSATLERLQQQAETQAKHQMLDQGVPGPGV